MLRSRCHHLVEWHNLEYSRLAQHSVSFYALMVEVLVKKEFDLLVSYFVQLDLVAFCLDLSFHVFFQELRCG